jgi:hypothetical protein
MVTDIITRPMKLRPKERYGPTTGNSNSSLRRTASEGGIEPSSSNHKTGKRIVGTFLNRLKSQKQFYTAKCHAARPRSLEHWYRLYKSSTPNVFIWCRSCDLNSAYNLKCRKNAYIILTYYPLAIWWGSRTETQHHQA